MTPRRRIATFIGLAAIPASVMAVLEQWHHDTRWLPGEPIPPLGARELWVGVFVLGAVMAMQLWLRRRRMAEWLVVTSMGCLVLGAFALEYAMVGWLWMAALPVVVIAGSRASPSVRRWLRLGLLVVVLPLWAHGVLLSIELFGDWQSYAVDARVVLVDSWYLSEFTRALLHAWWGPNEALTLAGIWIVMGSGLLAIILPRSPQVILLALVMLPAAVVVVAWSQDILNYYAEGYAAHYGVFSVVVQPTGGSMPHGYPQLLADLPPPMRVFTRILLILPVLIHGYALWRYRAHTPPLARPTRNGDVPQYDEQEHQQG